MRVVVDANVAIAGVAARGLCEAVMELCLERHHLVLCEELLGEIEEKLCGKIKAPPTVVAEYLMVLRRNAQILRPEAVGKEVCRDPDDLMVLGLVVPGKVDAIVTGDKDLLVIKSYKGARIMTPRGFWEASVATGS
jgi:putative PIN family toxin of toxin-antitoxin system